MKKKRLRKRRQPHRRRNKANEQENTVKQYEEEEGLKRCHAFECSVSEELMEQAVAQLQKAHDAATEVI